MVHERAAEVAGKIETLVARHAWGRKGDGSLADSAVLELMQLELELRELIPGLAALPPSVAAEAPADEWRHDAFAGGRRVLRDLDERMRALRARTPLRRSVVKLTAPAMPWIADRAEMRDFAASSAIEQERRLLVDRERQLDALRGERTSQLALAHRCGEEAVVAWRSGYREHARTMLERKLRALIDVDDRDDLIQAFDAANKPTFPPRTANLMDIPAGLPLEPIARVLDLARVNGIACPACKGSSRSLLTLVLAGRGWYDELCGAGGGPGELICFAITGNAWNPSQAYVVGPWLTQHGLLSPYHVAGTNPPLRVTPAYCDTGPVMGPRPPPPPLPTYAIVMKKSWSSDEYPGFICPDCGAARVEIALSLRLPGDAMWDEISLQVIACRACTFRGAATRAQSSRGALDDEALDHYGYRLVAGDQGRFEYQLSFCPNPADEGCDCAAHRLYRTPWAALPSQDRFVLRLGEPIKRGFDH